MTTMISPSAHLVPSENWDDDFEFQPNTTTTNSANQKNKPHTQPTPTTGYDAPRLSLGVTDAVIDFEPQLPSAQTRMSTASSAWTEDWDAESQLQSPQSPTPPNDNTLPPVPAASQPASPSTPGKRTAVENTENWDADFEDGNPESPVRKSRPSTPGKTRTKKEMRTPRRRKKSGSDGEDEGESWDEEFGLGIPPPRSARRRRVVLGAPPSPGSPGRTRPSRISFGGEGRLGDIESSDEDGTGRRHINPLPLIPPKNDDELDSDAEFGFSKSDEEDKTVTGRSRRAFSRISSNSSNSHPSPPPPPVPPFPSYLGMHPSPTQPFPRSPTSSVFSVPTSAGDHASSFHGSTTHLRPSFSRASSGPGLAGLPPSPPIHRERERRRLRKKSRPVPAGPGVFELPEVDPDEARSRPRTPSPRRAPSSSSGHGHTSAVTTPPRTSPGDTQVQTPSSGLLSRIGSVKRKWAVRRKKGSLAPEDIAAEDTKGRVSDLRTADKDPHLTPRPHSSASSFQGGSSMSSHMNQRRNHSPSPTPPPPSWFFRGQGRGTSSPRTTFGSRSGSMTDLSLRESVDDPATPSKLLKRKSLGFVQFRKGLEEAKRPMSMQGSPSMGTPGKYGGLGLGRAVPSGSGEDLNRDRKRSVSRNRNRDPFSDKENNKGKESGEENEGSRGFMGSVRRISLVGRHKRTKSGVSLSGVNEDTPVLPPTPQVPILSGTVRSRDSRNHPRSSTDTGSRHPSVDGRHFDRRPSTDKGTEGHIPRTPSKSQNKAKALLPPIELQPPSPPRLKPSLSAPLQHKETPSSFERMLSPSTSSSSALTTPTSPNNRSPTSTRKVSAPKSPGSPQSASLGRATINPSTSPGASGSGAANVPRRNSLGDLKIPARISQAQVSLRRDLGMVREFAANVEQLRELQNTYNTLVAQMQTVLDAHAQVHQQPPQPRAPSPAFFRRNRSNTNPTVQPLSSSQAAYRELASSFYTINSKYRISWECAELLIELATGASASSPPSMNGAASASQQHLPTTERKTSRERAITLAGDESKPSTPTPGATSSSAPTTAISPPLASPPALAWRASTGRHDLNHRQLVLLREMLNRVDPMLMEDSRLPIPEESTTSLHIQRDWRWGDAMSSTVTLPSTESSNFGGRSSPTKKRRQSRLGMNGIRDMLRALKRSTSDRPHPEVPPIPTSSTSLSAESSTDVHPTAPVQGRRRAKTSTGPESMRSNRERPTSPYGQCSLSVKASPRRPSLASIFRLGKSKPTPQAGSSSGESRMGSVEQFALAGGSTGEEDWDRIDSITDLDAAARGLGINPDGTATVRGKKSRSPYYTHELSVGHPTRPVTPGRNVSGSQTSLWGDSPSSASLPQRPTRLSNVEENADGPQPSRSSSKRRSSKHGASPSRPPSRSSRLPKSGSVRSMPPQPIGHSLPDPKLAMTPDNIKPLLENTKEVHARLTECISEIRSLLENRT